MQTPTEKPLKDLAVGDFVMCEVTNQDGSDPRIRVNSVTKIQGRVMVVDRDNYLRASGKATSRNSPRRLLEATQENLKRLQEQEESKIRQEAERIVEIAKLIKGWFAEKSLPELTFWLQETSLLWTISSAICREKNSNRLKHPAE